MDSNGERETERVRSWEASAQETTKLTLLVNNLPSQKLMLSARSALIPSEGGAPQPNLFPQSSTSLRLHYHNTTTVGTQLPADQLLGKEGIHWNHAQTSACWQGSTEEDFLFSFVFTFALRYHRFSAMAFDNHKWVQTKGWTLRTKFCLEETIWEPRSDIFLNLWLLGCLEYGSYQYHPSLTLSNHSV